MLTSTALVLTAACVCGFGAEPPRATRSEVYAKHGMAATAQPLATQIAVDVLKAGGSAVDAAIAANAALGLMEPVACGIGGDLFAIVWDPKTGKLHGYNGSGRAPAAATLERLKAELASKGLEKIPQLGALAVTVPGCVEGWTALHEKFGKLPMKDVLAPAIRYAREGFPVSPKIADAWARSAARLKTFPGFADQFMIADGSGGHAPGTGEIWTNSNLAATLERIAADGRAGFYEGPVAQTIAATLAAQGGLLVAADLAAHRGEWVEPVSTSYRGCEVWELPPNGQGIAALQILNILEGYDIAAMGFGSAAHVHAFTEAKKLAFEDRARLYGDPAFVKSPVSTLISKAYAARRREKIDLRRAARRVEAGDVPMGPDTTYLTVADESGMMVSLIQSNYAGMGSGVIPGEFVESGGKREFRGLGFMLQNRGAQFALVDGHPNVIAPGKRPFHTIIPAFITRGGKPWVSFGLMGGAMQPQGHAQIVLNLIDFKMTLQQAGDAPRIYHTGSTEPEGVVKPMNDGGSVCLELGYPSATIESLLRMGHRIEAAETPVFGGYQAIMRDPVTGVYCGATESRKDGCAAGW
jgi:gamma-glutamyltranspeptidase / glutathione hydrolase